MSKSKPTVDIGYPTEAHGGIPAFNSIEEEAAFWDDHSPSDYPDEFRHVNVTVGSELAEKITLRLEKADRDVLAQRAG